MWDCVSCDDDKGGGGEEKIVISVARSARLVSTVAGDYKAPSHCLYDGVDTPIR